MTRTFCCSDKRSIFCDFNNDLPNASLQRLLLTPNGYLLFTDGHVNLSTAINFKAVRSLLFRRLV